MKISYAPDASGIVRFAAEELEGYLGRMLMEAPDEGWEIRLHCDRELFSGEKNDSFRVRVTAEGGSITGNSGRSLLLGIYDYLHFLGCRFPMPGKDCEIIPSLEKAKLPAGYEKRASFYHRGVCIEGADSVENIRDYIDWLPKVGFNSFFLQFKTPYAFLARWYHHTENPFREPEAYTPEDAVRHMGFLEGEIKKRGLLLHKAGHGWTGEVLGYQTVSWEQGRDAGDKKLTARMAEINGKRGLYMGIPADTNLCYHHEEAADAFAALVLDYARENPDTDYVHVWLADEYNNVCECEGCRRTTLSDQYVELLNEIDRRLAEAGLDTRIVFLLYQELLWPPVASRLKNQDRFVLMFAPISRTFEKSYEPGKTGRRIPPYERNQITLPANLEENMAFLRGWQAVFDGDSFVYDYPLGRAHYGDFGYVRIAEVIHSDIQKLPQMGLDGYISCQELRAAFPNAFPNYVMGRTLFDRSIRFEELAQEYFLACYGEGHEKVWAYLSRLSELGSCDYVNGKGERIDPAMQKRMKDAGACCLAFAKETARHRDVDRREETMCQADAGRREETAYPAEGKGESVFWEALEYHRNYVLLFSDALAALAAGDDERAGRKWKKMREYICRNEPGFQPFLDVYRILEVTRKYTGLHKMED